MSHNQFDGHAVLRPDAVSTECEFLEDLFSKQFDQVVAVELDSVAICRERFRSLAGHFAALEPGPRLPERIFLNLCFDFVLNSAALCFPLLGELTLNSRNHSLVKRVL